MGTLADSLFSVLMSWVRALVSGIWALFSSERTTVLEFLGKNWVMIAVVLIAAGLVMDWLIWLIRWQPYHIWAQRMRRVLGIDRDDEPEEEEELKAHAAEYPKRPEPVKELPEEEPAGDLFIDEQEAREAIERAEDVPDEALGVYPGMRYGTAAAMKPDGNTQRYSALTNEGPGSAEVARRRAEIDAWRLQIQEEARQRAQAERAAREEEEADRLAAQERAAREAAEAEAARIAEEERLAREAAEAEAARIAEEERLAREASEAEAARIAEEERLAQEQYAREMEEYERAKAQYERELKEYERQKAEYDAQMARLAAQQTESHVQETAQDAASSVRRRRTAAKTYSDYVSGEEVTTLPPPPQWPKKTAVKKAGKPAKKKPAAAKPAAKKEKQPGEHKLLGKVAKMIEPQEEDIASYMALPPRVDMHDAYMPAKMPQKADKRKR